MACGCGKSTNPPIRRARADQAVDRSAELARGQKKDRLQGTTWNGPKPRQGER